MTGRRSFSDLVRLLDDRANTEGAGQAAPSWRRAGRRAATVRPMPTLAAPAARHRPAPPRRELPLPSQAFTAQPAVAPFGMLGALAPLPPHPMPLPHQLLRDVFLAGLTPPSSALN